EQAAQVLAGADHADGPGENIIENQRGHRDAGEEGPHAVAHHDVHAAADEHAAALHVDAAHGEAEQHHSQHEPRRRLPDGVFGNAAGIKRRRRQIAQDNGGAPPKADEGQRNGGGHHYFGGGGGSKAFG